MAYTDTIQGMREAYGKNFRLEKTADAPPAPAPGRRGQARRNGYGQAQGKDRQRNRAAQDRRAHAAALEFSGGGRLLPHRRGGPSRCRPRCAPATANGSYERFPPTRSSSSPPPSANTPSPTTLTWTSSSNHPLSPPHPPAPAPQGRGFPFPPTRRPRHRPRTGMGGAGREMALAGRPDSGARDCVCLRRPKGMIPFGIPIWVHDADDRRPVPLPK